MAPTALESPAPVSALKPAVQREPSPPLPVGEVLVIGSSVTAADGSYQSLITELGNAPVVEKQMIDRLLEGQVVLADERFAVIHVQLAPAEYAGLSGQMGTLLAALRAALVPRGALHVRGAPAALEAELTLAGLPPLPGAGAGELVARKPAQAAVALRSRRAGGAAGAKARLWTLDAAASSAAPRVDPEALLTAADKARPQPCEPVQDGAPRRKKACKNCTCGLAEIEAAEEADEHANEVVVLDDEGETRSVPMSEKERLAAAIKLAASGAKTSCGSCYLGDAFRCAGCPYRGLPAFEPGQKIELDLGDDDI